MLKMNFFGKAAASKMMKKEMTLLRINYTFTMIGGKILTCCT